VPVFSADWVVPVAGPPIRDGAVLIEDGRIAAVGAAAELGPGERFEDSAIVPGLVNAHSHLEYAVYAGFGDGLAFPPWLQLHIERKGRIAFEEMEAIARLGAAECLRSGITTTADFSFSGAAATACAELGLRAIVYLEVFGAEPAAVLAQFERTRSRIEHVVSDGVRLGVSPHALYTVSAEAWEACAGLGLPVGTHLAESPAEQEWLLHGSGPFTQVRHLLVDPPGETGPRLLDRRGLLGPGVVAVHCVHVDGEELDLLVEAGVGIAHCPRSNALLGCGIAPLTAFRAAGARVGIGTDSPASTPSFDAFEELRAALMGARAREQRPDALSAAEALQLATLGSARALGLEAQIGSLEAGKRADLAVVSLAGSPLVPWEDPAAAVVLGGAPARVLLTVVDGVPRYRRGETEWHELTAAASRARSRLLGRAGTRAPT
jgi:cytosine/adenosine deaminase-related metal-dependent hydrolase